MGDRLDILRSFVRVAADRVKATAKGQEVVERAARALSLIRHREVLATAGELQRHLAKQMSFRSLSLRTEVGRLVCDVETESGELVGMTWVQPKARFAAQGAKELAVTVETATPEGMRVATELLEAFAEWVAGRLWPGARADADASVGTIVERDQNSGLRVDLRSVPAVRRLSRDPTRRLLTEAVGLRGVRFEERGVVFRIHLAGIDGPT